MFIVLLCLLFGGGYKFYDFHQKNKYFNELVAQSCEEQKRLNEINDSIAKAIVAKDKVISDMQSQISNLKSSAGQISSTPNTKVRSVNNNSLKSCDKDIYFIMSLGFEIILPTGESFELECGQKSGLPTWTGTGFILMMVVLLQHAMLLSLGIF